MCRLCVVTDAMGAPQPAIFSYKARGVAGWELQIVEIVAARCRTEYIRE